jgi:hypothetical protein
MDSRASYIRCQCNQTAEKVGKSRASYGEESIEDGPELMDSAARLGRTWRQETGPGVVPW